jgi:hypothetical protein
MHWPTKAVQVISPFTAGNANDTVARVVILGRRRRSRRARSPGIRLEIGLGTAVA